MKYIPEGASKGLTNLEAKLAPVFSKFPHLPEGGKKFIVDVAPWIALILGILALISLVGGGAIASLMGIFASAFSSLFLIELLVSLIISIVSVVLMLLAFPGLRDKKKEGWNYVFASQVVSFFGSVFSVILSMGMSYVVSQFLMTVLWTVVGFWILFEIRSYYMGGVPVATAPAATPAAPMM